MITYIEKGSGLHAAINEAGYSLSQIDGVWVASDEAVVQAIIDNYPLAAAIAPLVAAVKTLAYDKIVTFLPAWKQSNLNARMNELNDERFSRILTDDELLEIETMRGVWNKVKEIRQASNFHEAALVALTDFSQISVYNIHTHWPEV